MISARIIKIIASCVASLGIVGGSYFVTGNNNKVDKASVVESNNQDITKENSPKEDNSKTSEDKSNNISEENINDVVNNLINSNNENKENNVDATDKKSEVIPEKKESGQAEVVEKSNNVEKEQEVKKEEIKTDRNKITKIEDIVSKFNNRNNQNSGGGTQTKESAPTTEPQKEVSNSNTADSSAYIAEIEQLIFQKVNEERTAAGLSALSYNNTMEHYARLKSKDMGDRGYFDHANPEGKYITDQMKADGVSYRAWGENIAYISGASGNSALADRFMTNWMNSSGHRANILSTNFTSMGVGVYKIGNTYYATQEFYK